MADTQSYPDDLTSVVAQKYGYDPQSLATLYRNSVGGDTPAWNTPQPSQWAQAHPVLAGILHGVMTASSALGPGRGALTSGEVLPQWSPPSDLPYAGRSMSSPPPIGLAANANRIPRAWDNQQLQPNLTAIEGGVPPLSKADYDAHSAMNDALDAGAGRREILTAAGPLMDRMRDFHGFTVMSDGLPKDPRVLSNALQETSRGLSLLGLKESRSYPTFGVYYGRPRLRWFEDGYSGKTGLAVPNDVKAEDLAAFVRPRIFGAQDWDR